MVDCDETFFRIPQDFNPIHGVYTDATLIILITER
jgi:hypothetical protein